MNEKYKEEKEREIDNGIKIGLHSSWTQHSFSYTNDILYRVYS